MQRADLRALATAGLLIVGVGACSTATLSQPEIAGQRVSGGYSEFRTE